MTYESVRALLSPKKAQSLYDSLSFIYDPVTRYEKSSLDDALEVAHVDSNSVVLDVGFGTGRALVEFAEKTTVGGVYGLDFSRRMIKKARRKLINHGLSERTHLVLGDAKNIPLRDTLFDVIFCSYMLDLIDTAVIPIILSEFKRLLKHTGRLVLVSLSKGSQWYDNMKPYEWAYARSPSLFGGCRPVVLKPFLQQLGFINVKGRFIHAGHLMPTEIVWGDRPA